MNRYKIKDINPNNYIRTWEVKYRKSKWLENDYEIFRFQGNFPNLLKELKKIMSKDIYTDFIIKEEE